MLCNATAGLDTKGYSSVTQLLEKLGLKRENHYPENESHAQHSKNNCFKI